MTLTTKRVQINDEKRAEMKFRMGEARLKGWTNTQIAVLMGVSQSCVGTWAAGRSMGTNHERDAIKALPMRDSAQARAMLLDLRARRAAKLQHYEAESVKRPGSHYDRKYRDQFATNVSALDLMLGIQ